MTESVIRSGENYKIGTNTVFCIRSSRYFSIYIGGRMLLINFDTLFIPVHIQDIFNPAVSAEHF